MRVNFKIAVFALLVQLPSIAMANAIVVVTNSSHPVKLSKDDCREIFMGVRTLVEGWRISPVDQGKDSNSRAEFYQRLAGRSPSEMKAYWAEQVFSGKARQPQVVGNDQAVIQRVLSDPDTIGYVDADTDTSKVNVVLKLD